MLVKKLLISLGFLVLFFICSLVAAYFANPTSTLFSIQRFQEYAFLAIQPTPEKKVDYYSSLLDKRVTDVEFVTGNMQYKYIFPTNLRYTTTAGKVTELVVAHNLTNKKEKIKNQLLEHRKRFDAWITTYPKEHGADDHWRHYTDTRNYIDIYLKKLE